MPDASLKTARGAVATSGYTWAVTSAPPSRPSSWPVLLSAGVPAAAARSGRSACLAGDAARGVGLDLGARVGGAVGGRLKKASLATEPQPARGWLSVKTAAEYLDMSPDALRRTIERHAVRAVGGGIEANIDGARARKFGRLWRIQFSSRWSSEVTT